MELLTQETIEGLKKTSDVKKKVELLMDNGYHLIPDKFNCKTLSEFLIQLASLCSNTALSFSMHLYTILGLWNLLRPEQKEKYKKEIENRKLFGSLNDPNVYFIDENSIQPNEYPIIVKKIQDGFLINGIKHFVSLEPLVCYIPVYGLLLDEESNTQKLAIFIIDKSTEGVRIINNWDSIAMPNTYSNSIVFEDAVITEDNSIISEISIFSQTVWLKHLYKLTLASVYMGIASSIVSDLSEVKKRKVPHTNRSLAFFPGTQFTIAEILVSYETALSVLERYCNMLDNPKSSKQDRNRTGLITKLIVSNLVEEIVNKAMKINGVQSLSSKNSLSKHYRDVKASVFHAPQQDIIYEMLSKEFLGILGTKNRWL